MLGLGGQLGINALGAFELGTIQTGTPFVPHRRRIHGSVFGDRARGALSAVRARGTVTSTKTRGTVGSEED